MKSLSTNITFSLIAVLVSVLLCGSLLVNTVKHVSRYNVETVAADNDNFTDHDIYFDQACDIPFSDGNQQSCETINCVVMHVLNFKHDNQLRSSSYGQIEISRFDFYHDLQLESNSLKSLQGYYIYNIYKLLI